MEETYYYRAGERIPVSRLRAAQVVQLTEERDSISIPGWRTVPLGQKRYQLLVRGDVISSRSLNVRDTSELTAVILEAEKQIPPRRDSAEERSLRSEVGSQSAPVLLGQDNALLFPTGEVVAKFHAQLDANAIRSEAQRFGGAVVRPVASLENTYVLRAANGGDGLDLANSLIEAGLVEFASPNFIEEMPPRTLRLPRSDLFGQQWHLNSTGQNSTRAKADVRAVDAWQITTGSPEIVICIIDSGIETKHEAFVGPGKLVPGFDFEDDDAFPDPTTSSHGTSCAGVAAAPWNTGRVVGIAPDCRLMPIRRATLSEHLKMAEALIWAADHGADIISCSFGYDNRPWIQPDIVRAAIDYCVEKGRNQKGCVIFWAAGNGGELVSTDEWASNEKVIAVGASTDQDVRAGYSDFGPEVDICAPSSGGRNSITTTSNGGYTNLFGGTSSAAPLAAGVAALLLSVNPNLTWQEVRDLLRQSADRIDPQNGRYDANGHSDWYGYGRVNALRALQAISSLSEAVRNSDVESRLPVLQQFAAFLTSRTGGQVILDFLAARKFRILELLKTAPTFRRDSVEVLRAAADLFEASRRGANILISERAWTAVAAIARLLLPMENELRMEEQTMEERSIVQSGNDANTVAEINELLQRLEEILRHSSTERGVSGNSTSSSTTNLPLEDFIEAASNAVLRAIDAREQQAGSERAALRTQLPIIVGLIFRPDLATTL